MSSALFSEVSRVRKYWGFVQKLPEIVVISATLAELTVVSSKDDPFESVRADKRVNVCRSGSLCVHALTQLGIVAHDFLNEVIPKPYADDSGDISRLKKEKRKLVLTWAMYKAACRDAPHPTSIEDCDLPPLHSRIVAFEGVQSNSIWLQMANCNALEAT